MAIITAYAELVISHREGLERATGKTVVHLAWLEILEQLEPGQQSALTENTDPMVDRQGIIERHLAGVQR